ncbi:amino acid permease [Acinetobacter ursingii]|uniref:amino acid permease n=1 Tax=Acinetobacter ursingii TaxID=108980 RepID=UPI0021CD5FC2|nr:amino acid permease [Acinetobacter ursingii]MCU4498237.1 amino acid permease [Acinetobacter ursingii]MDG9950697.1 amino acid permease [Acinetobacter ursingii]
MQHIEQGNLKKGLSNRHIQLIALGGSIGTGLFLGISQTIKLAGPSVILGYAIAGLIAFLMMRQLGEMIVHEPVSGSFSHFAYKYWGKFAGFMSGWNYWVLNILVCMAELSAVGLYIHYWWPDIPTWVSALGLFIFINVINLLHVKLFGEMEFWLAIIKVVAIIAMIAFGSYLLASGSGHSQSSLQNLWQLGGFFPNGITGLVMAMAMIMFAFGGIELVGIAAAETDNPQKTLPKAVNQIVYRVLLFYILSLVVILSLYPWNMMAEGGSPFVLIFDSLGSQTVAAVLNFVVLTAAVSVYNSTNYCTSRMLLGLAQQGNAPKFLSKINPRGIPVNAIMVSAFFTLICVLINYLFPEKAFNLLMMLVVAAIVINWVVISYTHLKFKKAMNRMQVKTHFPSVAYPFTNYLCIAFMASILLIMSRSPDMQIAVLMIPVWIAILLTAYLFKRKQEDHVALLEKSKITSLPEA